MTHNARTHADATWTNGGLEGYEPPPADWQDLDRKIAQSVNGDKGGTWAPSAPIVFADTAPASSNAGLLVTGPSLVAYGGSLKSTNQARFNLPNFPAFGPNHARRERRILTPCIRRMATQPYHWSTVPERMAIQSIACTVQQANWNRNELEQPSFVLPLRVHDGATLTRATLTFRVPNARSAGPSTAPRLRIIRVDASGEVEPLKLTTDGSGYVPIAAPGSAGAWMNDGLAQTFEYECDQNNVVDSASYYYEAQLVEEVGTSTFVDPTSTDGTLVRVRTADVTAMNVPTDPPLLTTPTFDGVSLASIATNGGSVLVPSNVFPFAVAGIYTITSVSPNVFAPVVSFPGGKMPARLLVGVEVGATMAQTLWEVSTVATTFFGVTGQALQFQRRKPTGNMYHSIACDFAAIPDMRFQ